MGYTMLDVSICSLTMQRKKAMEEENHHLSFEQWIAFAFDHPVPDRGEPNWYHRIDYDGEWWDPSASPETTIAYLTLLFENAHTVLTPFSDAQVNQGFWFLVDNSGSDHMFALLDQSVPWSKRKRCFTSIFTLFEHFFAPRCSTHLSHLDTMETDTSMVSPLNMVCYMWWDILPIHGRPEEPERRELDLMLLEVMRLILDLDSDACRESALHGLGHWKYTYPREIKAIIDAWFARNQEATEDLKAYAFAARRGRVL
jgi:hypothetical protein